MYLKQLSRIVVVTLLHTIIVSGVPVYAAKVAPRVAVRTPLMGSGGKRPTGGTGLGNFHTVSGKRMMVVKPEGGGPPRFVAADSKPFVPKKSNYGKNVRILTKAPVAASIPLSEASTVSSTGSGSVFREGSVRMAPQVKKNASATGPVSYAEALQKTGGAVGKRPAAIGSPSNFGSDQMSPLRLPPLPPPSLPSPARQAAGAANGGSNAGVGSPQQRTGRVNNAYIVQDQRYGVKSAPAKKPGVWTRVKRKVGSLISQGGGSGKSSSQKQQAPAPAQKPAQDASTQIYPSFIQP